MDCGGSASGRNRGLGWLAVHRWPQLDHGEGET
jgi:hypothetical protein